MDEEFNLSDEIDNIKERVNEENDKQSPSLYDIPGIKTAKVIVDPVARKAVPKKEYKLRKIYLLIRDSDNEIMWAYPNKKKGIANKRKDLLEWGEDDDDEIMEDYILSEVDVR